MPPLNPRLPEKDWGAENDRGAEKPPLGAEKDLGADAMPPP
jgi:hypothetical protein